MASTAGSGTKKTRAAFSPQARKRQMRVVALWFTAIGLTFVGLVAAFGSARAATASLSTAPPPAPPVTKVTPRPIRVVRDPLECALSTSSESGMLAITIGNRSTQVIEKKQMVIYEMSIGKNPPLHGVRAPVLIPIGGQFSALVPQQSDVAAGNCKAWIYAPLESPQTAVQ